MNILYITTSLLKNESASIRNISLINGLIENDCKVKVVTLDYVKNLEDTFLRDSLDSNIEVEKIKIPNFNKLFSLVQKAKENKKIGNSFFFKIKNLIKEFIFFPDVYFESIKNRNLFSLIESIDEYNKQQNNQKPIEFNLYSVDLEIKNLENKEFINIYPRLSFKEILEVHKKSDILIYIDNLYNSTQIPEKYTIILEQIS